ncbi:hypothetical protein M426DRAFT_317784 [Hypoxylon sp. CI-4A]|nr:hypothetical protein M426DRAFT_317784 [Hypoxylon sp. CI-4A]
MVHGTSGASFDKFSNPSTEDPALVPSSRIGSNGIGYLWGSRLTFSKSRKNGHSRPTVSDSNHSFHRRLNNTAKY